MIFNAIAEMGLGKTLFASLYGLDYSEKFPKNKIYPNYNLNLKNVVYTPYMFLPISEINNSLIIADDFYALQNSKALMSVIVNISRKKSIDVILTVQYYTMIPKIIRTLSTMVYVNYVKKTDNLHLVFQKPNNEIRRMLVKNAVKIVKEKKLYNTNEIVIFPTQTEIINEIRKVSKNKKDIEQNIMLYTQNKTTQKELKKLLLL